MITFLQGYASKISYTEDCEHFSGRLRVKSQILKILRLVLSVTVVGTIMRSRICKDMALLDTSGQCQSNRIEVPGLSEGPIA